MSSRYSNDSDKGITIHRAVDIMLVRKGWSPVDLIRRMGIEHRPTFYRMFHRADGPTDMEMDSLAAGLGVSTRKLKTAAKKETIKDR